MQDNQRYRPRRNKVVTVFYGRIVAVISVVCFIICGIAYFTRPKSSVSYAQIEGKNIYFVKATSYLDLPSAQKAANNVKKKGGAGYIIEGIDFQIFYAAFTDINPATELTVKLQSGGESSVILTYTIPPLSFKSEGDINNQKIAAYFDYIFFAANGLQNHLDRFQDGLISQDILIRYISGLKNNFITYQTEFANVKFEHINGLNRLNSGYITAFSLVLSDEADFNAEVKIKNLICTLLYDLYEFSVSLPS